MTLKRCPENVKITRRYVQFLKEAKGRDQASIDTVEKAIERYDEYHRRKDWRKFNIEQPLAFKAYLSEQTNARTGQPLSASTIVSTLGALKAFFLWLADQPDYRTKIRYSDAEYFNPPDNLARTATARRHRPIATLDQIRQVLAAMPAETDVEKRDRALLAFTILTGARDRAIVSFKLKHIDIERALLQQDAREVRTKRAKTFTTWFFPVGNDIRAYVVNWVRLLRNERGFGSEDPLFPKAAVEQGPDLHFAACGLTRDHWSNADPVRSIFRRAFENAALPYFNPHSFRNTLVQLAYQLRLDAERFKAWSQNLGHDECLTTFSSYGALSPHRQGEIISALAGDAKGPREFLNGDLLRDLADRIDRVATGSWREPTEHNGAS